MFEFLTKFLSIPDLLSVTESRNLHFKTHNHDVLNTLKEVFGEDSPYYYSWQDSIVCSVPLQVAGLSLLSVRSKEFKSKLDKQQQGQLLEGFLAKQPEKTEVKDGKPSVSTDFIEPQKVLDYLDFLIPELENHIDEDAYVWVLKGDGQLEDYYEGVYCKFSTLHSNKFDSRYLPMRRDQCLVTERYDDVALHWLPLKEGEVIKGENKEFRIEKLNLEILLKEQASQVRKMAEIARQYELELSKDNQ